MTDAVQQKSIKPELRAWCEAWKRCTQDVLSQVSGQSHAFEIAFEPLAVADSDLRYTVAAAGAVQGEASLRLDKESAVRLARKFLGEPDPNAALPAASSTPAASVSPDFTSDEVREGLEELLRQIAGLVASAVGNDAGGEIQLHVIRIDAPCTWSSDAVASLRTRDEVGAEITIELSISPALAAALGSHLKSEVPATLGDPALPPPPSGYRRLRDVGLGVRLRFGTRRMTLRDVLALSSGLVVELDNLLQSPVDLLLDGRTIARGEVVVIDGKYGLRVNEVVDPSASGAP